MDTLQSFVELGKFGSVGVILALILLVALVSWMLWKITTNHIEHTNSYVQQNTISNEKLIAAIDKWGDTTQRLDNTIRDFKK